MACDVEEESLKFLERVRICGKKLSMDVNYDLIERLESCRSKVEVTGQLKSSAVCPRCFVEENKEMTRFKLRPCFRKFRSVKRLQRKSLSVATKLTKMEKIIMESHENFCNILETRCVLCGQVSRQLCSLPSVQPARFKKKPVKMTKKVNVNTLSQLIDDVNCISHSGKNKIKKKKKNKNSGMLIISKSLQEELNNKMNLTQNISANRSCTPMKAGELSYNLERSTSKTPKSSKKLGSCNIALPSTFNRGESDKFVKEDMPNSTTINADKEVNDTDVVCMNSTVINQFKDTLHCRSNKKKMRNLRQLTSGPLILRNYIATEKINVKMSTKHRILVSKGTVHSPSKSAASTERSHIKSDKSFLNNELITTSSNTVPVSPLQSSTLAKYDQKKVAVTGTQTPRISLSDPNKTSCTFAKKKRTTSQSSELSLLNKDPQNNNVTQPNVPPSRNSTQNNQVIQSNIPNMHSKNSQSNKVTKSSNKMTPSYVPLLRITDSKTKINRPLQVSAVKRALQKSGTLERSNGIKDFLSTLF